MLDLIGEQDGAAPLTIGQARPEGRPPDGQTSVKVELSAKIGDGRSGIYMTVNDRYQIGDATPDSRARLFDFLEHGFEPSIRRADNIVDHVMSLATDQ